MVKARLFCFDLDGTIIRSYMTWPDKHFGRVELLPNRSARLAALRSTANEIAIITNQAGVAFGYNTEDDVCAKLLRVAQQLGYGGVLVHDGDAPRVVGHAPSALDVFVCYGDERSREPRYQDARRRKPGAAMLLEAAAWFTVELSDVLYIGDRPEDEQAAANAPTAFIWADDFFEPEAQ